MDNNILSIQKLSKSYDGLHALNNFTYCFKENMIYGLIGPNGAGKTTLFNLISGFINYSNGIILFKNRNLNRLPPFKISQLGIGRTFQELKLIYNASVKDNILLAMQDVKYENVFNNIFNRKKMIHSDKEHHKVVMCLLEKVDLIEKENDIVDNLSYGQQKILSILCCIASGADFFLFDEPFSGLSPTLIDEVKNLIASLKGRNKTVVIIEHNIKMIQVIADELVFLSGGDLICSGKPSDVIKNNKVIEAYLEG